MSPMIFFIHFGHSELRQLCKGKSMTKMEINCFFPVMQPSLKKKCGFFVVTIFRIIKKFLIPETFLFFSDAASPKKTHTGGQRNGFFFPSEGISKSGRPNRAILSLVFVLFTPRGSNTLDSFYKAVTPRFRVYPTENGKSFAPEKVNPPILAKMIFLKTKIKIFLVPLPLQLKHDAQI